MKTAIVHDWLVVDGGAEKVLSEIISSFPDADIFSIIDFVDPDRRGFLHGKVPRTSFIQSLPLARKRYRNYLPLMPLAIEQFDLSAYDLVISSSYAVAKGVITGPNQLHVSYVHSPARYAWDMQSQYLRETGLGRGLKGLLARWLLHKFRIWDVRTAFGVDVWLANSNYVARRIEKAYGAQATVIFPPVDLNRFRPGSTRSDYYVTASRMVPYKRMPLIVDTFARHLPDRKLVVIGDGPQLEMAKQLAGPNVTVMGYQSDEVLLKHLQQARAFIFAAEEDFGIAPLEAQACNTPVIAFGRGGARDTVVDGKTGLFFDRQEPEAIAEAVRLFEQRGVDGSPHDFAAHVRQFSSERFRQQFVGAVNRALQQDDRFFSQRAA
jgi:glycosyltransferase involved in cell wall biosynthesis